MPASKSSLALISLKGANGIFKASNPRFSSKRSCDKAKASILGRKGACFANRLANAVSTFSFSKVITSTERANSTIAFSSWSVITTTSETSLAGSACEPPIQRLSICNAFAAIANICANWPAPIIPTFMIDSDLDYSTHCLFAQHETRAKPHGIENI